MRNLASSLIHINGSIHQNTRHSGFALRSCIHLPTTTQIKLSSKTVSSTVAVPCNAGTSPLLDLTPLPFCFQNIPSQLDARSEHRSSAALALHFALAFPSFTGPFPFPKPPFPSSFPVPPPPPIPVGPPVLLELAVLRGFVLQPRDLHRLLMPALLHLLGVPYLRGHIGVRYELASSATWEVFLDPSMIATCTAAMASIRYWLCI